MQTRLRKRAHACGLVLCLLLSSCASDEPEPEIGEATSALGTRARETLLDEDFERGTLASPPWSATGDVEVREDAANEGALGVRLGARAELVARVDTRGRKRMQLTFDARTVHLEGFEALRVEVSVDRHRYFPIAHVRDCDWARHVVDLPRFVDDRAHVRVRFSVATYGKRRRWHEREGAMLDDVRITTSTCLPDSGAPDASTPDADVPDADAPDAEVPDAGVPDAQTPDGAAPDTGVPDAGAPDAGTCTRDADCVNASVCDGQERCEAGRCVAGTPLRCDDGVACTADRCDPTMGCIHPPGLGLPCEDGVCDAAGACVACVAPAHTYDAIQLRIFDSPLYLCTSCHRAGGRLLDLTAASSYAALLGQTGGRAVVTPYDVETSILYDRLRAKVEGTLPVMGGSPMPRGSAPAITRAELNGIAAWINAGVPRNGVVPGAEALCVPASAP